MYFVAEDLYRDPPSTLKDEFRLVLDSPGSEEDVQSFLADQIDVFGLKNSDSTSN